MSLEVSAAMNSSSGIFGIKSFLLILNYSTQKLNLLKYSFPK